MRVKLNETRTVFSEEIRRGSRRIGFLVFTLLIPVLLVIALIVVTMVRGISGEDEDRASEEDLKTGLLDLSGLLVTSPAPQGEGLTPDSLPDIGIRVFSDRQTGIEALLEGDITAFYIIPPDYVAAGRVDWLHTSPLIAAGLGGDSDRVRGLLREALVDDALDPEVRKRFISPATFESIVLKDDRSVEEGAEEASALSISYVFMLVMLTSVVTGSMYLLESVSDEKMNRMMEILLTSVSPMSIMAGKVFALGALGLAQVLVWVVSLAVIGPRILQSFPDLTPLTVEPLLIVWAVAFFLAGYFVVSVVMAGIGAANPSLQQSRQASWLVLVPMYTPMMFWMLLVEHPDGWAARALSFIPITAPATMMIRLGAADITVVETLASLLVTVLGGIVLLWGSARVFRAGTLMYGQRMGLRRVVSALRQAG